MVSGAVVVKTVGWATRCLVLVCESGSPEAWGVEILKVGEFQWECRKRLQLTVLGCPRMTDRVVLWWAVSWSALVV